MERYFLKAKTKQKNVLIFLLFSLWPTICLGSSDFMSQSTEPSVSVQSTFKNGTAGQLKKGWCEVQNGILILHLKGNPYEMGYQQGMLIKEMIGGIGDDPASMFGLDEQTEAGIRLATKQMEKFIPEEFREQLKGLAEALSAPYEDILFVNTFIDVMFSQGCTNFLVHGKASQGGQVIHGCNIEINNLVVNRAIMNNGKNVFMAVYQPSSGRRFAVIMPSPFLIYGFFGINDAKITAGLTNLPAIDKTLNGIPTFMLLRKVLQYADSVTTAQKITESTPRSWGASFMFADGKTNEGGSVEFSAKKSARRSSTNGVLFETNRMADRALYDQMEKGTVTETFEEWMDIREQRFRKLFQTYYGKIDVITASRILRDNLDLRTGKSSLEIPVLGCHANIASAIFRPADLDFWVARGCLPMCYSEYVGFNLNALLEREKSRVEPPSVPQDSFLNTETFQSEIKRIEKQVKQFRHR